MGTGYKTRTEQKAEAKENGVDLDKLQFKSIKHILIYLKSISFFQSNW